MIVFVTGASAGFGAAVEAAPGALPPEFAAIDVLVNNAGLVLGVEPARKADLDAWETTIETDCMGLVRVTHAFLPGMTERNRGHIFNLGSVAGRWPYAGGNVYGATKAFVRQFSLNLRANLAGAALRVTDIEPGLCDDAKAANVYKGVQSLTAEAIADSIYWIATRPAHVDINTIELMPVAQTFGGLSIHCG
jgi:3-hydroxy acid dehydrogenase / malonic semialdehyde reductase